MQSFFIGGAHKPTSTPARPACWWPCVQFYCKLNDFSLQAPTGPPARRRGRLAGGTVGISIANAWIFIADTHRVTSRPARPACWWPCGHFYCKCNDFCIADARGATSTVAKPACWWPCGHVYCKRNDFSLRTPTGPPAGRRGRPAGGPVCSSSANAMICHCGRPQGRQQPGQASQLVPLWAFPLQTQ